MTGLALETQRKLILTLIASLRDTDEYLTEQTQVIAPSVSLGRVTRMEALGEKAVQEHVQRLNQKRIIRLEHALDRIEAGTYGFCPVCNEEISAERLSSVPEAVMCIRCLEQRAGN